MNYYKAKLPERIEAMQVGEGQEGIDELKTLAWPITYKLTEDGYIHGAVQPADGHPLVFDTDDWLCRDPGRDTVAVLSSDLFDALYKTEE